MTAPRPTEVTNITNQWDEGVMQSIDHSATIDWDDLLGRIAESGTRWLTLVDDGRPHTRPVLAPVVDGCVWVASSDRAAKTRLLAEGAEATLAIPSGGLDVVWTGGAREESDPGEVERVAAGFREAYGWDVRADGNALVAPYAAPTAGPPPYRVFTLVPRVVHAIGVAEPYVGRSSRWSFARESAS
jgi:hypothetical protein